VNRTSDSFVYIGGIRHTWRLEKAGKMKSLPGHLGRQLRTLGRTPLFTAVAILALAIGIGANAALFTVVHGVLLKPLPFDEPDRLVGVWHSAPGMNIPRLEQGPAFYLTYLAENRVFEQFGLWDRRSVTLTGAGEPERVPALRVTSGILGALRVKPLLGRTFARDDEKPGGPDRVMLTHAYWQRKFNADRTIVGRSLTIEGAPREVIGVLPAGFRFFGDDAAMVLPLRFNPAETYLGNFAYQGIARLKPGVTPARAAADVERMIPLVVERFPMPPGFSLDMLKEIKLGADVHPLADDVIGDVGKVLWLLMGAVGVVLLIACANVANLFLVRAERRQQELAIRSALGAGWWRLARELLSESLVLALAGGVAGLALAWGGIRLLVSDAPVSLPRLDEITIGPLVVLFTTAISVVAGLAFGLVPVVRFARPKLGALKDGGRSASEGRERHRLRGTLVVAEIALALVLLVGAGLMVRTFQSLRDVQAGFNRPDEVLTLRIAIPGTMMKEAEATARMHEQMAARIAQVPGVTSVGLSNSITMDGNTDNDPLFFEDFPEPGGRMPNPIRFKWVGPGYVETLGNRLVAGRTIAWADIYARTPVAMISENMARQRFKTPAAAIGRRVRATPKDGWREIVGVVGDERDDGVARPAPMVVFWPFMMQQFWGEEAYVQRTMGYAIRTSRADSPGLLKEIQQAVWSVNANVPLANVRTLDDIRARSMAQTSFALVVVGVAAAVALLLGVVGIYGVIAYVAAQRTREIGIRMALGAQGGHVSGLFLRQGLVLTGAGIAVGLGGALAVTRLMATLLYGVAPTDPLTYVAVSLTLGTVAMLASYLPARRASRMDPIAALRTDA
jgi:putative ABC transport system permease protein